MPARKKHGMAGKRLYTIWIDMRRRCDNPSVANYAKYGAKGVSYCAEWASFPAFMEWALANGYQDDLTIDRKDNDSGYSPENCRWITKAAQNKNQRRAKNITLYGVTFNMLEWAAIIGISRQGIRQRLNAGYTPEQIILTPPRSSIHGIRS